MQIRKQAGNSVVIPKIQAVAAALLHALQQQPLERAASTSLLAHDEESKKIYAYW